MPKRIDRLTGLRPDFRKLVEGILFDMCCAGFDPWVVEGLRTAERQKQLYSIGRRGKRGEKPVTWTTHSRHQDGLAVDIISSSRLWNASDSFWQALGRAARKHSIEWGGDWRKRDLPHIEM